MKILILVALILQLVIIIKETDGAPNGARISRSTQTNRQDQYEFGDIIEFPRKCLGISSAYKHFAVYVGPVNERGDNDIGQEDNDIFQRTRKIGPNGLHCGFGKLEETREKSQEKVNNYLEEPGLLDTEDLKWLSTLTGREDIIKRINELQNKTICGKYDLINKNCEHLATYVRYGQCLSFQKGTIAGPIERRLKEKQNTQGLKNIEEKIKELRNSHENETQCALSSVDSASSRSTIMLSACLALLSSFLI